MGRSLKSGMASFAFLTVVASGGQAQAGTWDDIAWMYQPSEIVRIHLTLDEDQRASLNQEDGDWVGVGFWMEGSDERHFGSPEEPWKIEAKLKGSASFRFLDKKAAFNLKFPSKSRPDGLKRITLNNMVQDPSYLRETSSYEVMRASDLPAPRTGYAQLWVNDDYYGLYLNLEKYTDQFVDHWFSSTQHLFEASQSGQDILRTGDHLTRDFEVDEGDEDDLSDLEALTAAVRTGNWAEIQNHLADPEQVVRFLAAEWYLGHWDGYGWNRNNYYLQSDDDGMFTLLPSGTDQTFKAPYRSNFNLTIPLATAMASWNAPVDGGTPRGASALLNACVADQVCADELIHEIENVRRTAADLDVKTEVVERASALSPLIASDPRREYSNAWIEGAQQGIPQFLDSRDAELEALLLNHPLQEHTPTISRSPGAVSRTTVATFEFGEEQDAALGVSGYECRLDDAGFSACASPVVYKRLAAGQHTFEVRATNEGDTPSPPAIHAWTVAPNRHALTINEAGDGSGSVAADIEGPEYDEGSDVTLTATPDVNSTFGGWLGCDAVTDGDCVVTMDEARSVTAEFARIKLPAGVGRIAAPAEGKIKAGTKRMVKVKVENAGDEPLATTLWATSSSPRVRAKEALEVSVPPGDVTAVRVEVKATDGARGRAKLTFMAGNVKAVTWLTVKRPHRRR